MKEATGELNMTLVTIIAIAAVLAFVTFFLPQLLNSVGDKWDGSKDSNCAMENGVMCCTDSNTGIKTCREETSSEG